MTRVRNFRRHLYVHETITECLSSTLVLDKIVLLFGRSNELNSKSPEKKEIMQNVVFMGKGQVVLQDDEGVLSLRKMSRIRHCKQGNLTPTEPEKHALGRSHELPVCA